MTADRFFARQVTALDRSWSLCLTEPDAFALPRDIPADADRLDAIVPGTVAAALEALGRFDRNNPETLIDRDAWYQKSLADEAPGKAILRFEGLATIADVYLDDRLILSSESMFESHDVAIELTGKETLSICFRALKPHLEKTGPRARWRPRLMDNQGLRLIRTTALGFMPGWCPSIHAVGPFRPIGLIRPGESRMSGLSIKSTLDGNQGHLAIGFSFEGKAKDLRLSCNGQETAIEAGADGQYVGELHLPDIEPWWPNSHGSQPLYDVTLTIDGEEFWLARTGFRRIEIDRGPDGNDFRLSVNGERIFCRGAVWTTADILSLPGDREAYEKWLQLARDAGMNMIRIPGIATYESPDFFALCDELGILVWQDFMFANFDYPAGDENFLTHVKSETGQFLAATQASPSLAIVCGGSEIWQQGAMLGLPERIWKGPFCDEILAGLVAEGRPDLAYLPNSPCGAALPFFPNAGIAHYYGVGAYRQPLEDARRANVRFAGECLAFSNLSADETLEGGKAGIPRDSGADWDFEDVRDHYIGTLYGLDANDLRRTDLCRYLAFSRAVTGEVMETTYAEWRRPGSSCNGALTFTFQDVMAGPGWGVVDVEARPKPAWFALKRAFRPVQAVFSDEGTNGLDLHLINETSDDLPAVIEVICLRDGRMSVVSGRRDLMLAGRGDQSIAVTDLFGAFFDTTYAYRFGPPSHDVTVARLRHAGTGEIIAESFHFPLGRGNALHAPVLKPVLGEDERGFWLDLETDVFAQSVMLDVPGYEVADNGFHLAPGSVKRIALSPTKAGAGRPSGSITSLGGDGVMRF
ncbi:glycoside hydrolase family 2 protein [Neorhizobium alkalisoli]|uniref:beta-mannosidase n=1 Tax=Neorhizobium alkalisoli TaxID=528178 RepID=A0A561PZ85_9HYPH|nr:glycoside hydrolase family 2 protein [Neorhizobium alkalisoli]TWF43415.1 beta-mannosidase [Neorhizobium alkalisoli]